MKKLVLMFAIISLGLLAGCGEDPHPLTGNWESVEAIGGKRDQLSIINNENTPSDPTGTATVWFWLDDDVLVSAEYADITVSGSDPYRVRLESGKLCYMGECVPDEQRALDETLDCELEPSKTEMLCEGTLTYVGWEFEFRKND